MTFKISVTDDTFNRVDLYDLDDRKDKARFENIYGEDMQVRASHLYPGEIIRIACLERVDE